MGCACTGTSHPLFLVLFMKLLLLEKEILYFRAKLEGKKI